MIILGGFGRAGLVYSFWRGRGRSMQCNEEKYRQGLAGSASSGFKRTCSQQSSVRLGQGWLTYGMRKYFLGKLHSLLSQFFYISFAPLPFLYWEEHTHTHAHTHTHTHTYLTAYRLYMHYRCYQITLRWNIFTQIWSGAKCWLDIYHWSAGLTVTGRIRDIGQKVLESSFQTEAVAATFTATYSSLSHSSRRFLLQI